MDYKHYVFFILIVYLYSHPRYIAFLPTIPFYNNNEANIVFQKWKSISSKDVDFFKLTDPSITYAFIDHVNESYVELERIISSSKVLLPILFLKYIINRPRPYQINSNIIPLYSTTGNTPSLPAGHAFQAYYLAHVLSQRYPDKKHLIDKIAEQCDQVRVNGGIHYPSDGMLSKHIVNTLISIGFY
jgi:hypothetical protein